MSCAGLLDGTVGGQTSLCGKADGKGIQGFAFRPDIDVAKNQYVVKNGGLELGLFVNPAGGVGNPYYNDPNGVLTDCPAAIFRPITKRRIWWS